jgi:hypothetical protein
MRLHVLAELFADTSVREFGQQVQAISSQQFPRATQFLDVADPAAWAKQANDKTSAKDELRRSCGIELTKGPITRVDRMAPLQRWLRTILPNAPHQDPPGAFLLDWSCTRLQMALKSAYHYAETDAGTGAYKDLPEKNWASHLAEALEYSISRDDVPRADDRSEDMKYDSYLGRLR